MSSDRSVVIASAGVKPSPPAITRSAPASTTFSMSTRCERRDVRQGDGLGGEVAAVIGRDDPVANAEIEQDLGRGRGQRHDLLRRRRDRDRRAFVVGERRRKGCRDRRACGRSGGRGWGGTGDGRARGRRGRRSAGARGEDEDQDGEQGRRRPGGTARVAEENDGSTGNLRSGIDSEGSLTNQETPRFDTDRRRGLIGRSHGSCLPFSRRFEHAPCGRRPDSRSQRSAHRSGTVPGSHRLRDHTTLEQARYHGGRLGRPHARRSRCGPDKPRIRAPASIWASPSSRQLLFRRRRSTSWWSHDGCVGSVRAWSP